MNKQEELTYEEVVAYMEQATDVKDWNSRRANMEAVTNPQNIYDLDASGLIGKVLTK